MGLDIKILNTNESTRVGSYSSVHYLRAILIVFTIRYVRKHKTKYSNRIVRLLKSWLQRGEDIFNQIDYKEIPEDCPDVLNESELSGIYWFVKHSDCNGSWSVGQVRDITVWLKALLRAFAACEISMKDDYYQPRDILRIFHIYLHAYNMKRPVLCT